MRTACNALDQQVGCRFGWRDVLFMQEIPCRGITLKIVAQKVTEFLKGSDRFSKTIDFCVDIEHAEGVQREQPQLLLARQLPHLTRRLRMALDKLQAPETPSTARASAREWWRTLKARNAAFPIEFEDQLDIRANVKASRAEASGLNATIGSQKASIDDLNAKLEATTRQLSEVTGEKDSMSLFGASVSKATYNIVLWTIIVCLMLLLLLFVFRFRQSNVLTQEAKTKLADLEAEYEEHRRKSLEREQRISRQLQDEINKYKKSK